MEQWITDRWNAIRDVYKDSLKKKNDALVSYSVYMMRLLDGLEQMSYSQFHIYEKEVLWHAVKLFSNYYVEQAKVVLEDCLRPADRREMMEDIEEAVYQISNVYKNVVDSTANADRQMFTTLAVDTNMYDLSPRLCMFYTSILEELVEFFDQKDKYAFLLYPTLKCSIQTENLFRTRVKRGKVILICIPENRIEEVDKIPVYLFHEAFHTLSNKGRMRKRRSICLLKNMMIGMKQLLFRDVKFDELFDVDDKIKEKLLRKWFSMKELLDKIDKIDEEDRTFYSDRIEDWLCKWWEDNVRAIFESLGGDLISVIAGGRNASETDYKYFQESIQQCLEIETIIRKNLVEILSKNRIWGLADRHMYIYRETYADVACILILNLNPQRYEEAFRESIPYQVNDEEYEDLEREIRISVVADAVAECSDGRESGGWYDYARGRKKDGQTKIYFQMSNHEQDEGIIRIPEQNEIYITEQDMQTYYRYLRICAKRLKKFINSIKGIEEFRNTVRDVKIEDILSGKTEEKLKKIRNE